LYGWQFPHLPDDLCFYKTDGEVLLVTIAHERDSYLQLEESERDEVLSELKGLEVSFRKL
jgi:hypothetical protein